MALGIHSSVGIANHFQQEREMGGRGRGRGRDGEGGGEGVEWRSRNLLHFRLAFLRGSGFQTGYF